jgi:hypothetical protein
MSQPNFMRGQPLTAPQAARWFEGLRMEILSSVAQTNRTHVLTAFRLMAWEDFLFARPFGVIRAAAFALFRPKALLKQIVEKQNQIMEGQEDRARQEMVKNSIVKPDEVDPSVRLAPGQEKVLKLVEEAAAHA